MIKKRINEGFKFRTISTSVDNLNVVGTQEYNEKYDIGHYIIILMDNDGNIIGSTQTSCGVPKGKLTEEDLKEFVKGLIKRDELQEVKE